MKLMCKASGVSRPIQQGEPVCIFEDCQELRVELIGAGSCTSDISAWD